MAAAGAVWVRAPARLHLGLLDLRGDLGRRFGGIGVAVRSPSLLLEAHRSDQLRASGEEANRLLEYARRFVEHHRIAGGVELRLHRAIPAHAGLGSGTQLALATARALAALYDLPHSPEQLAATVGRARRSAIGTWAFARGGFLLEGGRPTGATGPAPLLIRYPIPASWRCVLAVPHATRGLSGAAEEEAFRTLPPPSPEHVGRISRLVLMLLLPSLVERDLNGFGRAVTEVQREVGETFRDAQGGVYAHPLVEGLVERMIEAGAAGAGQSSWGPAVYGLAEGDLAARRIARAVAAWLGDRGRVHCVAFDNHGVRVRAAPVAQSQLAPAT